ncbi:MAG TPA: asparagine synthase (glutamine-hydrolyzing) [bacterium]|nr:asparagine synthase (glutamine-hydrolyzing) [bacterium]
MCGINGFNWPDSELIKKMNQAISHRGPDDSGILVDEKFSLGHQRLSIIDLSVQGHQPMVHQNLAIVFNGEIYNFQELKKELEKLNYRFDSLSDTEVLLKGYHAWGKNLLNKLNGIFAFAIWDNQKQELFLARDHLGIKPLFYYHKNDKFIFSSELGGMLEHKNIDKTIVPERISFVIDMNCLPGNLTMCQYIYQLPAAHYAILQKNKLTINRYWHVNDFEDIEDREIIKHQIKELLIDAVKKQMISDVPLGVFLSGGIDSSIITMLAQKNSSVPIKTFSVGFDVAYGHEKYNADFDLARQTAKYFKTNHHELFLKKSQALEYMEDLVKNIDQPNGMTTAIPSYWLAKYAKNEVSVVLGGDGGDELFGGYPRYQLSLWVSYWQKLPSVIKKILGPFINQEKLRRLNLDSYLNRYLDLKCHHEVGVDKIFYNHYQPRLINDYLQKNYFNQPLPTNDFEKYFMWVDTQTWLVDHSLIRTDKTTMSFALEERVPILDHRLVELSLKIPTRYKVDLKNTKKIFKETFKSDLPAYLFKQPKRGWLSPAAQWLRGELKNFAYDVLADNFAPTSNNIIDLKAARQMLDDHISGKKYNLHLLWIIITYQLWSRRLNS